MERLDFSGYQYEFKPRNGSLNLNEPVKLNVDFTFLDTNIKNDLKLKLERAYELQPSTLAGLKALERILLASDFSRQLSG